MKKLILSAVLLLATGTAVMAATNDDRAVTLEQLPQKAQQFIKTHFAQSKLSYAQQDTDLFDGDYEVTFTDGAKIEFSKKGEWKDVECKATEVPQAIIPPLVSKFVKQSHPEQKITKIDRDSHDYEIKLSNGLELKFNLKGQFLGYDD